MIGNSPAVQIWRRGGTFGIDDRGLEQEIINAIRVHHFEAGDTYIIHNHPLAQMNWPNANPTFSGEDLASFRRINSSVLSHYPEHRIHYIVIPHGQLSGFAFHRIYYDLSSLFNVTIEAHQSHDPKRQE